MTVDDQKKFVAMLTGTRIETVKRLSICDCGYLMLKPEIPLGTEYEISQWRAVQGFSLTCGGCGKTFPVVAVQVRRVGMPESSRGMLPAGVFMPAN